MGGNKMLIYQDWSLALLWFKLVFFCLHYLQTRSVDQIYCRHSDVSFEMTLKFRGSWYLFKVEFFR